MYVRACVRTDSFIRFLKANNKCVSQHLQFGLLTDVTELNLGRNEITGTMPSEIGYMTKLVSGGDTGKSSSSGASVCLECGELGVLQSDY